MLSKLLITLLKTRRPKSNVDLCCMQYVQQEKYAVLQLKVKIRLKYIIQVNVLCVLKWFVVPNESIYSLRTDDYNISNLTIVILKVKFNNHWKNRLLRNFSITPPPPSPLNPSALSSNFTIQMLLNHVAGRAHSLWMLKLPVHQTCPLLGICSTYCTIGYTSVFLFRGISVNSAQVFWSNGSFHKPQAIICMKRETLNTDPPPSPPHWLLQLQFLVKV